MRQAMERPAPPPEALLIALARKAAGIRAPAAARKAGISKARWSQVENGCEMREGAYRPVRARDDTLAHMAYAIGVTPERLETEGRRPDAAAVLREILREPSPEPPPSGVSLDGLTPDEARIAREFIEALRRSRRDDGGHQQDGAGS